MNDIDHLLLRLKYALMSLDVQKRSELVEFVEFYASQNDINQQSELEFAGIRMKDAKKFN